LFGDEAEFRQGDRAGYVRLGADPPAGLQHQSGIEPGVILAGRCGSVSVRGMPVGRLLARSGADHRCRGGGVVSVGRVADVLGGHLGVVAIISMVTIALSPAAACITLAAPVRPCRSAAVFASHDCPACGDDEHSLTPGRR
jgi:hypothetical protein